MLMLAFVFQKLAVRKPDLDSGVYAYAKAGFGDYLGFISAFGFWASTVRGQRHLLGAHHRDAGQRSRRFGEGDTMLALVLSSVGIWAFHVLILRGVREAAVINQIVTIAKIIPILVFIVVLLAPRRRRVRRQLERRRHGDLGSLFEQVRGTMIITTFVFLGVEGASVYSRYAKKREDVGRATVLGFLSVLSIFVARHDRRYGVMPRPRSPRPDSRRWSACSRTWSATGARCSSASR